MERPGAQDRPDHFSVLPHMDRKTFVPLGAIGVNVKAYEWDDWDPYACIEVPGEDLLLQLGRLSHYAKIAFSTACAEWVLVALHNRIEDLEAWHYLDACWAAQLSASYRVPVALEDEAWQGPVKGLIGLALTTIVNTWYGTGEGNAQMDAAFANQLVLHILQDTTGYIQWRDTLLQRMQQVCPYEEADPHGHRLPRHLFQLDTAISSNDFEALCKASLQYLMLGENPYIIMKVPGERILDRELVKAKEAGAITEVVTELDLSHQGLEKFPVAALQLKTLKKLVLTGNPLKEIPEEIAALEELEELYLKECGLEKLPKTIGQLKKLKILDISANSKRISLPKALANCEQLQALKMNNTSLSAIQTVHANLKQLAVLEASGCTEKPGPALFPGTITRFTALRSLDLSGNPFVSIPNSLLKLQNLENLDLRGCLGHLQKVPGLSELRHLKSLKISGTEYFRKWPLEEKDKRNMLQMLPYFFNIPALEVLDLSSYYRNMPPGALAGIGKLKNLRILNLEYNDVQELPADIYTLKNLEEIEILGNNIALKYLRPFSQIFSNEKMVALLFTAVGWNSDAIEICEEILDYYEADDTLDKYYKLASYEHLLQCYMYKSLPGSHEEEDHLQNIRTFAKRALEDLSQVAHWTNDRKLIEKGKHYTRSIGNSIARYLYQGSDDAAVLKEALGYASLSGRYIESIEHYFVLDTQVRILLKLDRNEEAYTIVARVLSEDPDFKDFRDVRESPGYLQWISKHKQR